MLCPSFFVSDKADTQEEFASVGAVPTEVEHLV